MLSRLKTKDPQTLAMIALIAVGASYAIYWLVTAATWIPYPHQLDYGEGYNLFFAKLWSNGGWNWNINQEPYFTLLYGPVYLMIATPLINAFGLTFEWGRAIMASATAISCVFLGLIAYQLSKNKLLAIAAGLLPLTQPIIRDWGIQSRVDPLAVMFSIIGIWWAIKFRASRWFYAAPVFLAAAFYTKVDVIGIVAVVAFLAINREWSKLGKFSSITAALVTVPMIAFPPLYQHMIGYNIGMPVWDFPIQILMPIMIFAVPIVGILVIAIYYLKFNRHSHASAWLVAAVVICTLQLLKKGSSTNYYIETIYAVCLTGMLGLPMFIDYVKRHYEWKWLGVLAVGIIMILPIVGTTNPRAFPLPDQEYYAAVREVQTIIADTQEPIPTENAGAVVVAGKNLLIEPMIFTHLANEGMWDQSQYVEDVQNQRFDYLVLRGTLEEHAKDSTGHFTAEVSQAMIENYSLVYEHMNKSAWWYIIRVYEANDRRD